MHNSKKSHVISMLLFLYFFWWVVAMMSIQRTNSSPPNRKWHQNEYDIGDVDNNNNKDMATKQQYLLELAREHWAQK